MLCLGGYELSELQEPDFVFVATGPGSILSGPNFFKKGVSKQMSCGQNEETIGHLVTKIIR